MQVKPRFNLDAELRHIALARALRTLAPSRLITPLDRRLAYLAAGLCPVSEVEDAEALRRARQQLSHLPRALGEAA